MIVDGKISLSIDYSPSYYSKCSKFGTLFDFFVLKLKIGYLVRASIHKLLVRVANREDPDQTIWVCTVIPSFLVSNKCSLFKNICRNKNMVLGE